MLVQFVLGIVAMVMRTSELQPVDRRPESATQADPWWKPAVEVALGGLIVVVAVGARLALAYGWLN